MTLSEIQPYVASLLVSHPQFAARVTVLRDNGTYPQTPEREAALNSTGLVLIVWGIESEGLVDVSRVGFMAHQVYVPVVVERNAAVCDSTGVQIKAEDAVQHVLEAALGRPVDATHRIMPMDPPFRNFGTVNGIQRLVVNLIIPHHIASV